MYDEVSSDKKWLLASVTITVIGILLPWVGIRETSVRGIHLNDGTNLLILLIISLLVVHISRNMLAFTLLVIINSLSFYMVLRSYIDLFGSPQSPSVFDLRIGVFVTGIGVICMIIYSVYGIINERNNHA